MVKFLLVMPNFGEGRGYNLPLGIAYVSGALKAAGHEVHCLNLNHAGKEQETALARAVAEFDPDVVGTGTLSPYYHAAKWILDTARREKKGIKTLLGGGLLTASPDKVFEGLDVDIGVIGEGERTVVEMADALERDRDLEGVRGLIYRGPDGAALRTGPRDADRDLGGLAWPDFEGFDVDWLLDRQTTADSLYFHMLDDPRSLPMASSRSCPFGCTFCFHPTGRIYRERPLDDFFAELDHLVKRYRINMVEILDELFILKRDRLEEFCARIKPYGLRWWAQLHPTSIGDDMIALMADAGCATLGLGLESIHPTVLESMKKKTTQPKIEAAMKACFGKGMAVRGNFIFSDPAETLETANHTLEWWSRHRHYGISLIHLQVLPGSPLYVDAVKNGTITDDPSLDWHHGTNLTTMDDATYKRIMARVGLMDGTLLIPARILSFEPVAGEERQRFRVRWACPNCGAENDYREVAFDHPVNYQSLRLTCRSCGAWGDVENKARPVWRNATAEDLLAEGLSLRQEGRIGEALDALRKAVFVTIPPRVQDRPRASILAAGQLGQTLLQLGQVRPAVDFLGLALSHQAFDPASHIDFAHALLHEGSFSAAALHAGQARLLCEHTGEDGLGPDLDTLDRLVAEAAPPGAPPTFVV